MNGLYKVIPKVDWSTGSRRQSPASKRILLPSPASQTQGWSGLIIDISWKADGHPPPKDSTKFCHLLGELQNRARAQQKCISFGAKLAESGS